MKISTVLSLPPQLLFPGDNVGVCVCVREREGGECGVESMGEGVCGK